MSLFKVSESKVCFGHLQKLCCLISPSVPPPTVTITSATNQVVISGSNLTLTCNIQLDPSVDSTVMVNSTWTAPGASSYLVTTSAAGTTSTLMIVMAAASDGGTYTCSCTASPLSPSPFITPGVGRGTIQVYIGECVGLVRCA